MPAPWTTAARAERRAERHRGGVDLRGDVAVVRPRLDVDVGIRRLAGQARRRPQRHVRLRLVEPDLEHAVEPSAPGRCRGPAGDDRRNRADRERRQQPRPPVFTRRLQVHAGIERLVDVAAYAPRSRAPSAAARAPPAPARRTPAQRGRRQSGDLTCRSRSCPSSPPGTSSGVARARSRAPAT